MLSFIYSVQTGSGHFKNLCSIFFFLSKIKLFFRDNDIVSTSNRRKNEREGAIRSPHIKLDVLT